MAQALEKQGFEILPLVRDARRSAILGAVRELTAKLKEAGPGSVGFFYYSGHGAAEKDTNINYLIPVDAKDPGTVAFWDDSLKLDDVMRLLEQARGSVKFVVFDACRNELQLPTRDTSKGLVPVAEQQGFYIAYASAPGRTASDRGERSGPYAAALSHELTRRGLDHLNLFQNVKESVIASTGGAQHPWESNGLTKRVYLTGEPTTPADMALWETVSKSEEVASLQTYLARFPDGLYAATAKSMIARLERETAERAKVDAKRKAQSAELKRALDEAFKAREAVVAAEAKREAAERLSAAARSSSGGSANAEMLAAAARMADEEARRTREALEAVEARRKASEDRVAALEKAEQERREALEILRRQDAAAAKRAAMSLEALRRGQDELRQKRDIRVANVISINDKCEGQTPPAVEIVRKPQFGDLVVRLDQGKLGSVMNPKRQRCVGRTYRARVVTYVLDAEHTEKTGSDTFVLRYRHVAGTIDTAEYQIDLKDRVSTRTKMSRKQ